MGGGYDQLVNNADGSCLQIPDSTAGQPIEEAACAASDNQRWKISRI